MREFGKTKLANVLIVVGCCTIAVIAFQMRVARGQDPAPELKPAIESEVSTVRIEETGRTLPSSTGEGSETADRVSPPKVVVLTCRLDEVQLTTGLHKN